MAPGRSFIKAREETNKLSHLTRNQAMDLFSRHCSQYGPPDNFTELCELHGKTNMTLEQYIATMRTCAFSRHGLWADTIALHWAGISNRHTIEIFTVMQGTDGRPFLSVQSHGSPRQISRGIQRFLFTGAIKQGHYTPITLDRELHTPHPTHIPSTLYWEPQARQFCCLHAFNMLMSPTIPNLMSSPSQIISWFEREKTSPHYNHHRQILNETRHAFRPYDTRMGNFTTSAFAFWAHTAHQLSMFDIQNLVITTPDTLSSSLSHTLDNLTQHHGYALEGFLVQTQENRDGLTYRHMSTVIRHSGIWYWLDSEAPHRSTLSGHEGESNRGELTRIARQFYGFTPARGQGLHTCPLACLNFPPTPPIPPLSPTILVVQDSPQKQPCLRRQIEHDPREDPPTRSKVGLDTTTIHHHLPSPPTLAVQNQIVPPVEKYPTPPTTTEPLYTCSAS